MFVDQVKVTVSAGSGGAGCLSFRREKGVPKGGPDGGNGGDGGSIYFVSDSNTSTLAYFRYHPVIKAQKGGFGRGGKRHGKQGEDSFLKVPVGTVVREADGGRPLFDFVESGQVYLAAKGGKGGRGNASFSTSTRRAPRIKEDGKPGEEAVLLLELKLIADVGLVGFPNAGKSTLISKISAAKPVIADYPFTTLTPNLGVVDLDETSSFIVADIPGLIGGAHRGLGLGIQFLKHIERTKILVYIVDVSSQSGRKPAKDFRTLLEELRAFNPDLLARPQILVANKIDSIKDKKERLIELEREAGQKSLPFLAISALTGEGIKKLLHLIQEHLDKEGSSSEVKNAR